MLAAPSSWLYTRPWRHAALESGTAPGAPAAPRPIFIFVAFPPLGFRKWKACAGLVAGLLALVLISMVVAGMPVWKSYARAMRCQENGSLSLTGPQGEEHEGRVSEGRATRKPTWVYRA